jgi:hypothetical protein
MKYPRRLIFLGRLISVSTTACALWLAAPHASAADAKPTPPPAADSGDDEAPDPSTITLPGTVIERPNDKGYLSLTLEGGSFKLSFYDKNKQPVAPDVARAATHWNPKQTRGEVRAVMNLSSDGQSLKGNTFVQPPFPLRVFITLLSSEEVGVESHTVMFKP